jgi:hypothetical protein
LSKKDEIGSVDVTATGFTLVTPIRLPFWKRSPRTREVTVDWKSIKRIDGGRRDAFTVDEDYLLIFHGEQDGSVFVSDWMEGFHKFEAALFENIPEANPAWQALRSREPFEECYETLWDVRDKTY